MTSSRKTFGRDPGRSHFLDPRDGADDDVELAGEPVELVVGQRQARQPGQVGYLSTGYGHLVILEASRQLGRTHYAHVSG
jgi:hypothetical protein